MITVIITAEDGGIDSNNYWGYALRPVTQIATETEEETKEITLIACHNNADSNFEIATFRGDNITSRASKALESLINAIQNNERSWDVDQFFPESPF